MNRLTLAILLIASTLSAIPAFSGGMQVCFSPPLPQGCDPTQTIVQAINAANQQVLVQAYSFTAAPIAKSIVDAKRRGLDVRVILDKSNLREGYSAATFLEHAGVPVFIDSAHAIAHNKVMVIDGQTVITGSFNFTKAAEERNAENLVVLRDPTVASQYVQNWNLHAAHSQAVTASASLTPGSDGANTEANEDAGAALGNPGEGPIVGNRRSHIYAWRGCGSYDTMAPQNRVVFPSAQAAETAGYRAAHNCP